MWQRLKNPQRPFSVLSNLLRAYCREQMLVKELKLVPAWEELLVLLKRWLGKPPNLNRPKKLLIFLRVVTRHEDLNLQKYRKKPPRKIK